MASADSLWMRSLLQKGFAMQVGTDTPVSLRMRYIGTGTVTSVTTTTATNIVMITSDGGTDTYAFATYTTVGALADAINADGIFEVRVLDALRSEATASHFVTGAITAGSFEGVRVWDVLSDTSASKTFTCTLSLSRGFDANTRGHRVHLQQLEYYATLGAAAANKVQIWERSFPALAPTAISAVNEDQLFGALSVSATDTTINFASGLGKITGAEQSEIVVVLTDGTSLADATANFLRISGIRE